MTKTVCFDCETGGLQPFKSALCSVTLKVVGEDKIKTIYVKPQKNKEYHPRALEVNGLTKEYLEQHGVSEPEAIEQVKQFLKEAAGYRPIALAHNIIFDAQFMNALFARNGQGLFMDLMHYHPVDTMILMKVLKYTGFIKLSHVNLGACYRYFFNEDFQNAHTSEGDVLATEKLYEKILELLNDIKVVKE